MPGLDPVFPSSQDTAPGPVESSGFCEEIAEGPICAGRADPESESCHDPGVRVQLLQRDVRSLPNSLGTQFFRLLSEK